MYLYTPFSTKITVSESESFSHKKAEVGENNSLVIIYLAQNYKFTEDATSPSFQDICEHNAVVISAKFPF